MTPTNRSPSPALLLGVGFVLLLGYALTIRVPSHKIYFFSDEATYHSMAYSLGFDGDVRYQRHDLERVYARGYVNGPTGLFLKQDPGSGNLYFAKAFLYPAAVAPFVRALGDNGFFVFHTLLLGLVLWAGVAYLQRSSRPWIAALWVVTYFGASIAFAYYFWITPEWFNLALLFLGCFLWLYKIPPVGAPSAPVPGGWLTRGWTDYAAAALFGLVAYSKPPHAVFLLPLLVWSLAQRRWRRTVLLGLTGLLVCAALFGVTWLAIGDWNYQGGIRKTFYFEYPYESPAATFEALGSPMATGSRDVSTPGLREFLLNLVYIWIGRNGGLLVYMFPAVLAVGLFTVRCRRILRSAHALLIAACGVQLLAYLTLVANNWIGGGGTLGSRYFMTFYPALFFVLPAGLGVLGAVSAWSVAALFLAQILLSPFASSHHPSRHTVTFPFKLLPPELTILHNLPFNTNPRARRATVDDPRSFFLYFLDDNTYFGEPDIGGFWVRGESRAEVVIRTPDPVETLVLELRNGSGGDNRITATLSGERHVVTLAPDERATVEFTPGRGLAYEGTLLYRFIVGSEGGFVPKLHDPWSGDNRHLGVLVRPRVRPEMRLR